MPLTNFHNWKKKPSRSVSTLLLDLKNPRLVRTNQSQVELIAELVEREDVLGFAKRIEKRGFIPVDDLIGVEENGKTVIVEGNRRLAAYKCLNKPSLAPPDFRSKFEKVSTKLGENVPKNIPIVISPNRAEANIYIFDKHNESSFDRKWNRVQQAAFVKRRLEDGTSMDEIEEETGMSSAKINESVDAVALYEIAGALDLPDEIAEKVTDPKSFPYSTVVERIFSPPSVRKLLGIDFDRENGVAGKGEVDEFKKIYAKILTEVCKGKTTRDFNTVDDAKDFVKKLNYTPAKGKKFTGRDLVNQSGPPVVISKKTSKKKAAKKTVRSKNVFTPKLICEYDDPRIPSILEELQKLKIEDFPNATVILMRTLLELSLIKAFRLRKEWYKVEQSAVNKKIGPTLSEMIKFISTKQSKITLETAQQNAIDGLGSGKKSLFSSFALNSFVHNPHYPADPATVRAFAAKLQPLFEKLLSKP